METDLPFKTDNHVFLLLLSHINMMNCLSPPPFCGTDILFVLCTLMPLILGFSGEYIHHLCVKYAK